VSGLFYITEDDVQLFVTFLSRRMEAFFSTDYIFKDFYLPGNVRDGMKGCVINRVVMSLVMALCTSIVLLLDAIWSIGARDCRVLSVPRHSCVTTCHSVDVMYFTPNKVVKNWLNPVADPAMGGPGALLPIDQNWSRLREAVLPHTRG